MTSSAHLHRGVLHGVQDDMRVGSPSPLQAEHRQARHPSETHVTPLTKPRALTASEVEWLRREGLELQRAYSDLRARIMAEREEKERASAAEAAERHDRETAEDAHPRPTGGSSLRSE
jgi:hypothetical protein